MSDTAIEYTEVAWALKDAMGDFGLVECSLCGSLVLVRPFGRSPVDQQAKHTEWHRSENVRMHEAASRYEALRARSVGRGM